MLLASGAGLLVAFLTGWLAGSTRAEQLLYLLVMATGGWPLLLGAYHALRESRVDMYVLMTVALAGALAIGEWAEGAVLVFLFAAGNWLQLYTTRRTRHSLRELLDLRPARVLVRREGGEMLLPVEQLRVGDTVLVRPGEKIAVDGVVLSGESDVDQSPVTGEAMPVYKQPGDQVYAGTINGGGLLTLRATCLVDDSLLARMIRLVEQAEKSKAPQQQFVDVFARYYTPLVVGGAVLLAVVPGLLGQPFLPWLKRALILLVISCPCALVISTPVAIVSAIGTAARRGVLIKGGVVLEVAGQIRAVAFDKTGTLTTGQPRVVQVVDTAGGDQRRWLAIAAALESRLTHPLAGAILHYVRQEGILPAAGSDYEFYPGRGGRVVVDGSTYYIGSPRLLEEKGVRLEAWKQEITALEERGCSLVLVGCGTGLKGIIAVADRPREEAADTLHHLRRAGMHTIMLTGDHPAAAAAVAGQLGLDEFRAGLLPEEKLQALARLRQDYGKVAMLGDGVNDAPALAASDLGIAMGAAGSDVALETAGVVLLSDDLGKLPYLVSLSRRAGRVIRQNMAFALLIKLIFIAVTLLGMASLWLAVLADSGAAVLVTLNALRLVRVRA
ncbi:MAG: heavy metal translocating P-type ATPase [Desulfurispora sp.]